MTWKERDRALAARARGTFRPQVNQIKELPEHELVTLYMGPHKPPTHYARVKIPLAARMRGRVVTLPWRKV